MIENINVSIILPTYNEEENLLFLIPELLENLNTVSDLVYEIIVVDDNSTDKTEEVVRTIIKKNDSVKFVLRQGKPSLPLSILEGIKVSKYEYVLWMDADGSMPAFVASQLIEKLKSSRNQVIIGSRFVKGGGYKGINSDGNNSIVNVIKNIYKSEDSILAVFLSRIFNLALIFLLNSKVKDVTSGFITGKKDYFKDNCFTKANYGDYFVYLMSDLLKKDIPIHEIGYICLTRKHGKSKTANNIFDLAIKGWPYIKAAFISRIE